MKRILSLLLVSVLLLSSLASCVAHDSGSTVTTESLGTKAPTVEVTDPSTNEPTGETTKEPDNSKPEVAPTVLPEATSEANLTCFGTSYKLYTLTDLSNATALEAKEGNWTVESDKTPVTLLAKRADGGSQYQAAKWNLSEKQNWSAYNGVVFYVDYSAANTDTFHGVSFRIYSEVNGIPMIYQPVEGMTAYTSKDGENWFSRTTSEKDEKLMHVSFDKKFQGYVYIPFNQFEGCEVFDLVTAFELNVARVTSGEARIGNLMLVKVENPYDKPTTDTTTPTNPLDDLDMDKFVTNPTIEQATNFADIGAGKVENIGSDTTLAQGTNGFISLERNDGDWVREFDWKFNTPQNWSGMAGILIKVDFTAGNTNSSTGGHGASIGIHTAAGTEVIFNNTDLSGYAFVTAKDKWYAMEACSNASNLLVIAPGMTNRYAGFVYIPYSAFGAGVAGLDSVTAITVYAGALTSGTAIVEGIWIVKGTEIADPNYSNEPVVNPDLNGTPVQPGAVQSPVDFEGVVKEGSTSHVTNFTTVGQGSIAKPIGNINVTSDGKISVERDGGWYDSFDWIFKNAQNWSAGSGLLVKVDFTSANTDSSSFHGLGMTIYTKSLTAGAAMEPAKGAYVHSGDMWMAMELCSASDASAYLGGGKRYAGYIFIPFSSFENLSGLEHVTGFRLHVGAITSGTAYVEGVYLVSGEVQVVNALDAWLQASKQEQNNTVLEGITINALGDSYFAGNGLNPAFVWPQLLATKYNATLNNNGRNGSTMSNLVNSNPMCERYKAMARGADIILVEGGRNDFNNNVPIGTIDSYDTKTLMGALNTILKGLKEANPNSMIVVITCWNFPGTNNAGYTYADYANAMLAVAAAQGVYSINASDPSVVGVDMTDSEFKKQYSMTPTDISHLSLKGMMLVMPKFEAIIAEYYTEFLANHVRVDDGYTKAETEWHKGYVGSSSNSGWTGKINTSANNYSYSDVIVVEKAGTTITFVDDGGFASAAAYVFSFWKLVDGEWVFDDTKTHYAGGSSAIETEMGSTRVYAYTTTEDNECIRICYRSEHTDDFTPAFPTVFLSDGPLFGEDEDDNSKPEQEEPVGTPVTTEWNKGYVGSASNTDWAGKINTGSNFYSHSGVIVVEKAGTTIYFIDYDTTGTASGSAYVISFWKQVDGEWVIDEAKTHFAGNNYSIQTNYGSYLKYSYTTTEDNECIRLCYRSEQTGSFTPEFPTVYLIEGTETPDNGDNEQEPTVEGTEVTTNWHKGYVGSSSNSSWAGKINTSANFYSHSDVIVIEKAGTTITFTDEDASGIASGSAYVISFWKQVDGEWVIDDTKTHFAGNNSTIQTKEGNTVTYSYTTTEDNVAIRLCYRSEQTADFTPTFPTVILIENNK